MGKTRRSTNLAICGPFVPGPSVVANAIIASMATLLIRNVDPAIVRALKARAGRRGVSAEAEHRSILKNSLACTSRKSLADVLRSIPRVGTDADFERRDDKRDRRVSR
jgi:antitoxin FitA